ncbi:MAG: DUF3179 domain-containing protein [Pseudomonadota bacterium]
MAAPVILGRIAIVWEAVMLVSRRHVLSTLSAVAGGALVPASGRAQEDPTEDHLLSLLISDRSRHKAAFSYFEARGGTDLISPLIFALRFTPGPERPIIDLLQTISGDTGPQDWHDWMLWQERHPEIVPHPALIVMKRQLYLTIDSYFEPFLKPEFLQRDQMKIRLEEIAWGGVRKDGIPSLDNPISVAADAPEAGYLVETDLVFGVAINGDKRAYPLRIMGWHEMFNDVIGDVPVALAYCTLCGSGILFESAVDGRDEPFIFGSSGFLYRSNKVMYDKQTHSLWNQFTGKPVSGELVNSGIELTQRPVTISPWGDWVAQNPDTRVITLRTGFSRDYGSDVVYRDYFSSPELMFPTNVDQTRLRQKDYVFGVRRFGGAKAWALDAFTGGRVLNDELAGTPLVLIGNADGRTVRAYERGPERFAAGSTPSILISDGKTWTITEEMLEGPEGARLPRVAGHIAYWFAWDGYLGARSEFFGG